MASQPGNCDAQEQRNASEIVVQDASQSEPSMPTAAIPGLSVEDEELYRNFTRAQRRRVRTKVDVRLIPVLAVLYLFAQLDRSNIGNAKIEGLKEDTDMTDEQYNMVVAAFFIPYFLLEIPSNMVLKGLERPSRYLGCLVLAWGIVMTCHGFARSFEGMLGLRFLLGATEAGFYPAAMYLCTQWYQPHELAFRFSMFMALSAASGIASGLLAAAIAQMDGMGGYEGWRWIFLVEGAMTIVLGVLTWFFLLDTPQLATSWLTPDEIRYLEVQRLIKGEQRMEESKRSNLTELKSILTQWRFGAFGSIFHAACACGYGLKISIPTIIQGLGYGKSASQLLSAIPYAFGVLSAISAALSSDLVACRSVFTAGGFLSMLVGFTIIIGLVPDKESHRASIIVGMSFVTAGVFPVSPICGSWVANNIASSSRRAIGLAFVVALGSLGGLTGSFMYVESEAPDFPLGYRISCGLAGQALIAVSALAFSFWRENKHKARVREAEGLGGSPNGDTCPEARWEKSPLFRYTL